MVSDVPATPATDAKRMLEFGPLNRPRIRSGPGIDVFYVDHCSLEELKAKYAGHPGTPVDEIMPVHFVADGRPLAEITAGTAPFDFLVASHVIEHVPDLIGWLKDAVSVLRVGGVLNLIVPDKRFTFDIYRPLANREELAAAHREKRSRPGARCIADHFANVANVSHVETYHLWEDYRRAERIPFANDPEFCVLGARHFSEGIYVDVHCWVFTPWSFLKLIGWMCAEFDLRVDLDHMEPTRRHMLEFEVNLRRTKAPSTTDWTAAAEQIRQAAPWPLNGPAIAADIGIAV